MVLNYNYEFHILDDFQLLQMPSSILVSITLVRKSYKQ